MSIVKTNAVQLGQSLTATNNFTLYQPASPDGTVRLGNGNAGSVTDLVTLTSAGNLGIGTSSPGYRLEVAYGSTSDALVITGSVDNITPYLSFKASNGGSSYIRGRVRGTAPDSTNGGLAFDTGASGSMSEKMRLDSSGNLGLGVTPSGWGAAFKALQIGNNTTLFNDNGGGSYFTSNAYYDGGGYKYLISAYATNYAQYNGQHQWRTAASGTAGTAITFTPAMTLDASGNLLVGATSNPNTAVIYAYQNGIGAVFNGVNNNGSFNGTLFYGQTTRAASTAFDMIGCYANSVGQFRVSGSGVIYAQNTTVQSISDARLKENVRLSDDGLSVINLLRPVRFDWKEGYGNDRKNQLGFIAQEVESVFPDAVDEWTKIKEGDDETYKTVGPSALIPVLVKAIQELSAELNELKQKVNA